MEYLAVAAGAVVGGIIQSVTGFGAAIFLMLVAPYFYDMLTAPAVTCSICMGLGMSLAWKFRRHIQWNICLVPTLLYLAASITAINLVKNMELRYLTIAFGCFLVLLAVYFFVFSERISFRVNWKSALVCGVLSGAGSGLFGIGGPLMAIYFVSACKEKEAYIGNIQFLFAVTNLANLITRAANGIYTVDLIPVSIIGLLGVVAGKQVGLRILDKLNPELTRKLVYAFVGVSGVLTVVQQL